MDNQHKISSSDVHDLNIDSDSSADDHYKLHYSTNKLDNQLQHSLNMDHSSNIFNYYSSEKYQIRDLSDQSSGSSSQQQRHPPNNDEMTMNNGKEIGYQQETISNDTNKDHKQTTSLSLKNENDSVDQQFIKGNKYKGQLEQDKSGLIHKEPEPTINEQPRASLNDSQLKANSESRNEPQEPLTPSIQKKRKRKEKIFKSKYVLKKGAKNKQEQLSLEEHRAMSKVYFEKKRENREQLKQWNYRRLKVLEDHRQVISEINKSIDEKMNQSLKNFDLYQQFFKDRADQQQKYLKNIPRGSQQLSDKQINTRIYMAPSSILDKINNKFNAIHESSISELVKFIRQEIIKNLFENYYFNDNKKKMISIRQQISGIKIELEKISNQVANKLIRLQQKFIEASENLTMKKTEISNDFYLTELSFLRKCYLQMQLQVELANKIIQYCQLVKQEEKQRAMIIKQGLLLFEKGVKLKEISYGNETNADLMSRVEQMSSKRQEQKLIEEFYSFEELLCEDIIATIKKSLKGGSNRKIGSADSDDEKLELPEIQFFRFFTQYPLSFQEPFNCRLLIIKEFKVEMEVQSNWVKSRLIITIDKFVHVIPQLDNAQSICEKYHKPYFTMKAAFIKIDHDNKGTVGCDRSPQFSKNQGNPQNQGSSCSQNQSESTINMILVKLTPKKTWKNFLFEGQEKQRNVRFFLDQELSEFEDYIQEFSN